MRLQRFLIAVVLPVLGCNLFTASPTPGEGDASYDRDAGDLRDAVAPDDASGDVLVADAADAADAADVVCVPESTVDLCARIGTVCGATSAPDNCGELRTDVVCGNCPAGELCDAGQCVCAAETDQELCTRIVADCGTRTADDNCGVARTVDCGGCTAPATCGGGGTPNVCACAAQTDVDFCAANGATCGPFAAVDECGLMRTVNCGSCASPDTCGGSGTASTCGCPSESDAVFCARVGGCGLVSDTDNCGQARSASCGGCPTGEACSANVCVCQAEGDAAFCSRLNACETLTAVDNCAAARTADCGTCGGGEQCTNNQCACVPEDDNTFCARNSRECGTFSGVDNCAAARSVASCGACGAGETCDAGSCSAAFPPAGIETWLRADGGTTLSMQGEVTEWADRLTGELWIAPTQPSRPTFISTAHLGFDGVRFFGGQFLQRASSALTSEEFTAFFVVVRATTDREGPILATSANAAGPNELTFGTTDTTMRFDSTTAGLSHAAAVLPTTSLAVLTVRADGADFDFFQGDTLSATVPLNPAADFEFDQIGGLETLRFMRGDLFEVMLWPRSLSETERAAVLSYLTNRYSL